jgi:hypothetical protein
MRTYVSLEARGSTLLLLRLLSPVLSTSLQLPVTGFQEFACAEAVLLDGKENNTLKDLKGLER